MSSPSTAIYGSYAVPASQRPENTSSSGAGEVLEMAKIIAAQANATVNDVENRLAIVMHPSPPTNSVPGPVEPDSMLAPLFNDLRCELRDIRGALHAISRMIGRLDL